MIFWIVLAVLLGIIEGATMGLVAVWFIVGAVAAVITASITASVPVQATVFTVVSAVALIATRPAVKRMTKNSFTPTNSDRIIGRDAVVSEEIDPVEGTGLISIGGQIWSAKSAGDVKIKKDEMVRVKGITGVRAVVEPIKEEN